MILSGDQARHACSRELNMQSSIISANFDAQITGIKEFGFAARQRYFDRGWTVDPPDREQSLLRRAHTQSNRRFEIGNVRGVERIKRNRGGNVLTKRFFVNPNTLGYLCGCFGSE